MLVPRVLVPLKENRDEQLSVDWESRGGSFLNSLEAVLAPPSLDPEGLCEENHSLRIAWIKGGIPGRAMFASVLWHVAAVGILLLPIWKRFDTARPRLAPVRIELTWYQPPDLPRISPPGRLTAPKLAGEKAKAPPRRGADAYHPRQTIVSMPEHMTHPRQTLIRPDAPPAPPKIAPPLPNIAEWAQATQPAAPKFRLAPTAASPRRRNLRQQDIAAPDIHNSEKTSGPINIASSPVLNPRPALVLNAHVAPVARQRSVSVDEPAAENLGASLASSDSNLQRLIAISVDPAPPAPVVTPPNGNLAARVTISPDGAQPGAPGGAPDGTNGSGGSGPSSGTGTGISGPPGVSITGGHPANPSSMAGLSNSAPSGFDARRSLATNTTPSRAARVDASPPRAAAGTIDTSQPPEKILNDRRIYTLHVNMPNLTSASGSWILKFALLRDEAVESEAAYVLRADLSGPVPLRKVDPKYPPALMDEHVEGEVVLYAIIRKDGSVDSIQVVRSLDPQLDQNAMDALAHWKFRPAERAGEPVELETVVHIPFRASSAGAF
jgi:TonB family protein